MESGHQLTAVQAGLAFSCVVDPRMVGSQGIRRMQLFRRESGSLIDELNVRPFNGPILGRKRELATAQPSPKQRQ